MWSGDAPVSATMPAIMGLVLVLFPLALLLSGIVGKHVYGYSPTVVGQQMITTALRAGTELLSPWKGVRVLSLCPSP